MKELKDIPGYEGKYAVTADGEVWSYTDQIFMSPWVHNCGYLIVSLQENKDFGKQKNYRVHRLVAMTYIPNPEGKEEVDHINKNKMDNRVENLRWVTSAENKANAEFKGSKKVRTKVRCVETGEVFKSMVQAAEFAGCHRYNINLCLLGKQLTAGGYHWERVYED